MTGIPPKEMAGKMAKMLQKERPDQNYLQKVFEHIRNGLSLEGRYSEPKRLPELMTEDELKRFYDEVWHRANRLHVIMLKLLLFTGIRNAELANILIEDVDLDAMRIRIRQDKGAQERYVPFPPTFRGELGQYVRIQNEKGATFLFETNRVNKFTTRWIREIVRKYALKARIKKRIHPHLFRHQLLTFLTQKDIVDAKIQLIIGHKDRKSLGIHQYLSLVDIEKEYREAMKDYPIQ